MTLREHLEAIRDRHHAHDYFDVYDKPLPDVGCAACPYPHTWPCPDRADAVAALKALDEAAEVSTPWFSLLEGEHRLVPDPAPPTENTPTRGST